MNYRLEHDSWGRLTLIGPDGNIHLDVTPVRAFPLTAPDRCISICDSVGHELLFIDSLDGIDPQFKSVIQAELAQREFVPVILRIRNTPSETEPSIWNVDTDRGTVTFEVEGEDSIHCRDGHSVAIVDSHGIRYAIHNWAKLDAHSRRAIEKFL